MLVVLALVRASVETASAGRYRQNKRNIGPGVTLTTITDSRGPNQMRLLTIDPAKASTIDVALSKNSLSGYEKPSSMATKHGAIAAVNGDFGVAPGRPIHAYLEDGTLYQTALSGGKNFAIRDDETASYIGSSFPSVRAVRLATGETFGIDRWNTGAPSVGEIIAYTDDAAGAASPPTFACSARLQTSGPPSWGPGKLYLQRTYSVDASACQADAMNIAGGVVLSTRTTSDEAVLIRSLDPGDSVRLTWTIGWPDVLDSIGGGPTLMEDGKIVAPTTCWDPAFCARNPRTGVGITATGKILILTVDGRQKGWSVGMTPVQFAKQFKRLGAVFALNLDGGGSTTMWVKGKTVNRPSDAGGERAVSSALLVLPGADSGEPLSPVRAVLEPPPEDAGAAALPATDPGSTGGYLESLYKPGSSKDELLPQALRDALHLYRTSS